MQLRLLRGGYGANARILLRLPCFLAYATHITLLVSVLWAERHWVTTFELLCPYLTSPLSERFSCAYVFGTIKEGNLTSGKRYPLWHPTSRKGAIEPRQFFLRFELSLTKLLALRLGCAFAAILRPTAHCVKHYLNLLPLSPF